MPDLTSLANLIKDLRAEGKRFVVMLGAGASLSSDVPNTRDMMKAVLDKHGTGITGRDIEDRFDQLMRGPEDNRRLFLKPYLDKKPSDGYKALAELIKDGYFDTVITFNFDNLLEKALGEAGVVEFATIVRGEFDDAMIPAAAEQPGTKIIKLHGSLRGVSEFVFTREDLVEYPPPIRETVGRLTARDIMVCGYAYNDQCVITSFSKTGPGNMVIVNPDPAPMLRDVGQKRRCQFVFEKADGYFDTFFTGLKSALKPQGETRRSRTPNPFKFLEAYRPEDRHWYFGREDVVEQVKKRLREESGPAFFITGLSKVGKTSFIRAGLMPKLKPEPLYLRCQPNVEKWLPGEIARRQRSGPAKDLAPALASLKPRFGSRFYLILDQFERVVLPYEQDYCGQQEFEAMLGRLMRATPDWMTVFYVARNESGTLTSAMKALDVLDPWVNLKTHDSFVDEVIEQLTQKAGISFDPEIIRELKKESAGRKKNNPFTLAHVNAVCHLMCDSGDLSGSGLKDVLTRYGETLDRIINRYDVIGFVEDIPFDEAARALFPRMLKVISKEGYRNFAECLCDHFGELFPDLAISKE